MSKGPMAPSGSFDDLKDPCGLEHNEKEKRSMERGSWKGGQTPAHEDFRILIFILKPTKKKHLRVYSRRGQPEETSFRKRLGRWDAQRW